MKITKTMRYCRVVFTQKQKGTPVEVDFGFCSQDEKMASIKQLRESYSDHSFQKFYTIDKPRWSHETPSTSK